jgi:hypothetical protein
MPSKSAKQARMMAAVAHNPGFAKKVGIPQSVGKDFNKADKGHKFGSGGIMKNASPAMEKKHAAWMKSHGAPKSMVKEESAEADEEKGEPKGYKRGGKIAPRPKKMPLGKSLGSSLPAGLADMGGPTPPMGPMAGAGPMGAGMPGMKKGGRVAKGKQISNISSSDHNGDKSIGGGVEARGNTLTRMVKMAKGGSVGRGDGCASKGKTKARIF